VTYRAKLLTATNYSAAQLAHSVEMLTVHSRTTTLRAGQNSTLMLSQPGNCSTRIAYLSEPLCPVTEVRQVGRDEDEDQEEEDEVSDCSRSGVTTLSSLVVYLLAEFMGLIFIFAIILLAVFCCGKARRKK